MKIRFVSPSIAEQSNIPHNIDIPCKPVFYDDYLDRSNLKILAFDTEHGQIHVDLNPRELLQLALQCMQQRENWERENFDDEVLLPKTCERIGCECEGSKPSTSCK